MEWCSSTWITSDVLPASHHSDFKALRNLPNLDYFSKDNRDSLRTHVGSHWVNVITLPLNQHGSVWISNIWIRQFLVVYLTDERLGAAAGCETLPPQVSLSQVFLCHKPLTELCVWLAGARSLLCSDWLKGNPSNLAAEWIQVLFILQTHSSSSSSSVCIWQHAGMRSNWLHLKSTCIIFLLLLLFLLDGCKVNKVL